MITQHTLNMTRTEKTIYDALPSPKQITDEMNKLPFTKHLDEGRYNEGVINGFEMGVQWALKFMINKGIKK